MYKLDRSTFIIIPGNKLKLIRIMHTYVVDIAFDEVVGLFAIVEVPDGFSLIVVLLVFEVATDSSNNVNYTIMN